MAVTKAIWQQVQSKRASLASSVDMNERAHCDWCANCHFVRCPDDSVVLKSDD